MGRARGQREWRRAAHVPLPLPLTLPLTLTPTQVALPFYFEALDAATAQMQTLTPIL